MERSQEEREQAQQFTVTDRRGKSQESAAETARQTASSAADPSFAAQTPPPDSYEMPPQFPEASLLTLIISLYANAQIALGVLPDPMTQQQIKDLPQAKYNIDLLDVLKEKTKNNVTPDEEQALEQTLYELRMTYVASNT